MESAGAWGEGEEEEERQTLMADSGDQTGRRRRKGGVHQSSSNKQESSQKQERSGSNKKTRLLSWMISRSKDKGRIRLKTLLWRRFCLRLVHLTSALVSNASLDTVKQLQSYRDADGQRQ